MKIDKSVLAFGTSQRVSDRQYLDSFKDRTCVASSDGLNLCGLPAIAAHVRTGLEGGTGLKPSDDLVEALCHAHHMHQESHPGYDWWFRYVHKPRMRRDYRDYKKWRDE